MITDDDDDDDDDTWVALTECLPGYKKKIYETPSHENQHELN